MSPLPPTETFQKQILPPSAAADLLVNRLTITAIRNLAEDESELKKLVAAAKGDINIPNGQQSLLPITLAIKYNQFIAANTIAKSADYAPNQTDGEGYRPLTLALCKLAIAPSEKEGKKVERLVLSLLSAGENPQQIGRIPANTLPSGAATPASAQELAQTLFPPETADPLISLMENATATRSRRATSPTDTFTPVAKNKQTAEQAERQRTREQRSRNKRSNRARHKTRTKMKYAARQSEKGTEPT